jgi:hypothetical protein
MQVSGPHRIVVIRARVLVTSGTSVRQDGRRLDLGQEGGVDQPCADLHRDGRRVRPPQLEGAETPASAPPIGSWVKVQLAVSATTQPSVS